jgi:hypothetical protein
MMSFVLGLIRTWWKIYGWRRLRRDHRVAEVSAPYRVPEVRLDGR